MNSKAAAAQAGAVIWNPGGQAGKYFLKNCY